MPRDWTEEGNGFTAGRAWVIDLYRSWRKYNRDRVDLAMMSDIELQDIGLPTFSAWRVPTLVILPRADGTKGARTCKKIIGSIFATIVV